jgi:anaerobic ribonucleoside-triphosphate reductase activating protein
MNEIRLSGIISESIVDGPGIRMVLFAQGCKHNCSGCHNPETHSFVGGKLYNTDLIINLIKKNPLLDGLTFSGGEPFEQAEVFSELAVKVKQLGLNIMTYTGYTLEYLQENPDKISGCTDLINNTDILVDGRFDQTKKNILLKFRGSDNQRVIDLKNSKMKKEIVLANI